MDDQYSGDWLIAGHGREPTVHVLDVTTGAVTYWQVTGECVPSYTARAGAGTRQP